MLQTGLQHKEFYSAATKKEGRAVAGQIKSKERVADHGEVFTNEREVNAMLDMVKPETERVESRFLEPACGNGNFLAEVLRRKLEVVDRKYKKLPADWEKFSIVALSSLYGVDILSDNVEECQERLFEIWNKSYQSACKKEATDLCRDAARYILAHNILCGNALDMCKEDGSPIVFAQWDLVTGTQLKRRDYRLDELLSGHEEQLSFDMVAQGSEWEYDPEVDAMMPKPIREYPPMDYRRVQEVQD